MTHRELRQAEQILRRDDKALRLRFSQEGPNVLIERKVTRGRIGSVGPDGLEWTPDAGYRRENGHVPVASVPAASFDLTTLREALRAADTWRKWDRSARPHYEYVEEADDRKKAAKVRARQEGLRYKASELYDRYAWTTQARVRVPETVS